MWIYKSPDDHHSFKFPAVEDNDSTTSSSIGNNSDAGCDSDDDVAAEVQSLFKGSLNNLSDLQNAFPVKKGISTFYSGKSKSYTSLADAVSVPSIQDIVKPEDAYKRKRKNMLAHSNVVLNKDHSKSGTSKKIDMTNNHYRGESSFSRPPLPAHHRLILPATNESLNSPPRNYSFPLRSLSLSDLQHADAAASSVTGSLSIK